jgi:hypothetical protein
LFVVIPVSMRHSIIVRSMKEQKPQRC